MLRLTVAGWSIHDDPVTTTGSWSLAPANAGERCDSSSIAAQARLHLIIHHSLWVNAHVCAIKPKTSEVSAVLTLLNDSAVFHLGPIFRGKKGESIMGETTTFWSAWNYSAWKCHGSHSANKQLIRSTFTHLTGYWWFEPGTFTARFQSCSPLSFTGLATAKHLKLSCKYMFHLICGVKTCKTIQNEPARACVPAALCLQMVVVCENPGMGRQLRLSIGKRARAWQQCWD